MSDTPIHVKDIGEEYRVDGVEPSVPAGYQRTDVGVIPDDWDVQPLRQFCTFSNGVNADKRSYGKGIPFVNVLEAITYSHLRSRDIQGKVDLPEHLIESFLVRRGDVVFNRTSEVAEEVGLAATYCDEERVVFGGFVIRGRLFGDVLNLNYAGYGLRAPAVRTQIVAKAQGAVRANIGQQSLGSVLVPLPGDTEQRAIAEALSDVDGLLEALDRLIAKKRAIKQAAMQQLLTGKTRLPGFDEEWNTLRLGEIAIFAKGAGLSKGDLAEDGARRCIHYGELFTSYGERIHKIRHGTDLSGKFFYSISNDVLMPTSDVTPNGLATASCISKSGVILGGDILVIRAREQVLNGEFLAYAVWVHRAQVMQLVSGTTVFHLYGRDMAQFTFFAPDVEEQKAIVRVLSDLDEGISALEKRRDKTQEIKQGMMQQLLTGRTRLIESDAAAAI